jgi:uncharacterized protein (DUF433 family)
VRTMTNRPAAVTLPPTLFTIPEAAWAVRTPEGFINKEIDNKIVLAQSRTTHARLLDRSDLSYFRAVREIRKSIEVELRKRIYIEVRKAIKGGDLQRHLSDVFILKLNGVLDEIDRRICDIIEARASVEWDPRIRGGAPVVVGTRIPVHTLGEMVRNGAIPSDLAEEYELSDRLVELALLYDKLHPRRGRPARGFGNNFNDMWEHMKTEVEDLGEYPSRDIPITR